MPSERLWLINRPKWRHQGLTGQTSDFEVVFCYQEGSDWMISLMSGFTPHSAGGSATPEKTLKMVWGSQSFAGVCEDLGCGWFVELVQRMASGGQVTVRELADQYRVAYLAGDLPSGSFHQLREVWMAWAATKPDKDDEAS